MTLADLPPHWRTREWLESVHRYESFRGVTTRHPCDCGRSLCRSGPCLVCLEELLKELEETT